MLSAAEGSVAPAAAAVAALSEGLEVVPAMEAESSACRPRST